jgi:hypothetical protein
VYPVYFSIFNNARTEFKYEMLTCLDDALQQHTWNITEGCYERILLILKVLSHVPLLLTVSYPDMSFETKYIGNGFVNT